MKVAGLIERSVLAKDATSKVVVISGKVNVARLKPMTEPKMPGFCASMDREELVATLKDYNVVAVIGDELDRKLIRVGVTQGLPFIQASTKDLLSGEVCIDLQNNLIINSGKTVGIEGKATGIAYTILRQGGLQQNKELFAESHEDLNLTLAI